MTKDYGSPVKGACEREIGKEGGRGRERKREEGGEGGNEGE